ncbi:hypothetical protein M413DRAFT_143531 [Hebeloma cylindrosporum]|uniref:Uncharacterized protein n=1 Tax=Hebeloma cylindrosporum TaxID=76867 RepID=A0A0C2YM07_HEBCY|nr:hypothetical protein M413DRAFT_143531 [Hebeloma cylindrosporum h7]
MVSVSIGFLEAPLRWGKFCLKVLVNVRESLSLQRGAIHKSRSLHHEGFLTTLIMFSRARSLHPVWITLRLGTISDTTSSFALWESSNPITEAPLATSAGRKRQFTDVLHSVPRSSVA